MVDVSAALGMLAQLSVVLGALAAGYLGLRRWIQRTAGVAEQAAKRAAAQLETSDGSTVGQYVEQVAADVTELRREVGTLADTAAENRRMATEALTLARHVGERVDAHLTGHTKE